MPISANVSSLYALTAAPECVAGAGDILLQPKTTMEMVKVGWSVSQATAPEEMFTVPVGIDRLEAFVAKDGQFFWIEGDGDGECILMCTTPLV